MEVDSEVWVYSSPEIGWVKAKVASVEKGAPSSAGHFQTRFELLLQDDNGALTGKSLTLTSVATSDHNAECSALASEYELVKLRNHMDERSSVHVDDLVILSYLHEPSILWTLRNRFKEDIIYTNTGPILIAINPFKNLHMYSREKVEMYRLAGESGTDSANQMKPHVFKVADGAYRNMVDALEAKRKADQSILVSGESGAGKTETTKFIMRYLADVTKATSISGDTQGIEHLVLQSNPILESFGNARTLRNDNSSRFGKFIEINFARDSRYIKHHGDESLNSDRLRIDGATIRTYLLEKVRLVFQSDGERNYHCFYELLEGSSQDEKDRLGLSKISDYKYINQSGCYKRFDGVNDCDQYILLRGAMKDMGFSSDEEIFVMNVIAAVLHLGNLEFADNHDDAHSCSISPISDKHVHFVCQLLNLELESLQRSLCEKEIVTRDEVIRKKLAVADAEYSRDALAKTIYGALFEWLVFRVNDSIQKKSRSQHATSSGSNHEIGASVAFIGVLDIFGFENFVNNSFEQLCINYTNETLQQHFNQFVFEYEQTLYEQEGISWSFVSFPDNKETLDLLEHRQKGIFAVCDDQARFQWSTHVTLANRLYELLGSHPRFGAGKSEKARNLFVVKHYAGNVCYDAFGFLEKNNDLVSRDMIRLLKSSTNVYMTQLLLYLRIANEETESEPTLSVANSAKSRRTSISNASNENKKSHTLGAEFRRQLKDLMGNISLTTPHYIRCIKPNSGNTANIFDPQLVVSQLRCCGVIEAVRVSRAGFPNRLKFIDFQRRYGCLIKATSHGSQIQQICEVLSQKVLQYPSYKIAVGTAENASILVKAGIQVGSSMIFMRKSSFDILEHLRLSLHRSMSIIIQAKYRCFHNRKRFEKWKKSALQLQCRIRMMIARLKLQQLRELKSSIVLQKYVRRYLAQSLKQLLLNAIIKIQAARRMILALRIRKTLQRDKSQIIVAKAFRRFRLRKIFLRYRSAVIYLQNGFRKRKSKKILASLKAEAKSIKKITEERDSLLLKVREWEKRFASLEQSQVAVVPAVATSVVTANQLNLQDDYMNGRHNLVSPHDYQQLQLELQKTKEMLNALLLNGVNSASTSRKQSIVGNNGWSKSVSTNYSIINNMSKSFTIRKSVEQEITIPIDSSVREKQLQEQLQQSTRELSRYKFRVKQLEEQNRKMSLQLLSITDGGESVKNASSSPTSPAPSKFSPKPKIMDRDRDSDDSMDESDAHQIPTEQDLDDKKDNWAAYLESFDDRGSEDELESQEITQGNETTDNEIKESEGEVDIGELVSRKNSDEEVKPMVEDHLDYFYPSSEMDDKAPKRTVLGLSEVDEGSIMTNPMLKNLKKSGTMVKPQEREIAFSHFDVYKNKEDEIPGNIDHHIYAKLNPHSSRDKDNFEEVSPLRRSKQKPLSKSSSSNNMVDNGNSKDFETSKSEKYKEHGIEDITMESNPLRHPRPQIPKPSQLNPVYESKLDAMPMEVNPLRNHVVGSRSKESLPSLVSHNSSKSAVGDSKETAFVSAPQIEANSSKVDVRRFAMVDDDDDSDNESSAANSSVGFRGARMVSNLDDSDNEDSDNEVDENHQQESFSPIIDIWEDQNPDELIFELIAMNNIDLIDQLLSLTPRVVRAIDQDGRSPLHIAAQNNLLDVSRMLVSINAQLDAIDQFGKSPLHYARDPNIVEMLAEEGANVNIQDNGGVTPLLEYCREECHDCVKAILPYGANPMLCDSVQQRHCLHVATLLGSYELLMLLTEETQITLNVDKPDQDGFTALHFAASGDRETGEQLKILMLLLDKGAEVKMGNTRGVTALHLICANRMLSRLSLAEPMVEMLISFGAHPNMQDSDGCTPLIVSVAYREWNLCKQLLEAGGDLNIPCSMSSTFLQGGNGVVDVGLTTSHYDKKTLELMATSDCTASDLLPKTPRYKLFGYIRVLQTRIPGDTRDRCMNCANPFSHSSYFRISSGKHHCRHCNRVVCQACSPNEVSRQKLPSFVQNAYAESTMRICVVCYAVLIEMKEEE